MNPAMTWRGQYKDYTTNPQWPNQQDVLSPNDGYTKYHRCPNQPKPSTNWSATPCLSAPSGTLDHRNAIGLRPERSDATIGRVHTCTRTSRRGAGQCRATPEQFVASATGRHGAEDLGAHAKSQDREDANPSTCIHRVERSRAKIRCGKESG